MVQLNMENIETSNLLTVKDVAEYLNVSQSTIRQWVAEKKIPFIKLVDKKPGTVRFSKEMINNWINRKKIEPNDYEDIDTEKLIESSKSHLPEDSKKVLNNFENFLKKVKEKTH